MLSGRLREHDARHRAGAAHLAVLRAEEEDRICGALTGREPASVPAGERRVGRATDAVWTTEGARRASPSGSCALAVRASGGGRQDLWSLTGREPASVPAGERRVGRATDAVWTTEGARRASPSGSCALAVVRAQEEDRICGA
jgi:hypothetical protein